MKWIFLIGFVALTVISEAQIILNKRKKPTTTNTSVAKPIQNANATSSVSTVVQRAQPQMALSEPLQMKLKLPFSTEEKMYWVRKMGNYYIMNDDIIVGDNFPKLHSLSVSSNDFMWPNATIPVLLDPSVYSNNLTDRILSAIYEFNHKTTVCIVPRTTEADYVRIVASTTITGAGSSKIGRQKGQQDLFLHPSNASVGTVMHELMHAAGIYHEQARSDRNNHVMIKAENVTPGLFYNFQEEPGDIRGDYDYGSIMHYDSMAFSANGKATIQCPDGTRKERCQSLMGNRKAFSEGDIMGLAGLYSGSLRAPCQTLFPVPNRGWQFANTTIPDGDIAQQKFRHRAEVASKAGFVGAFPNFHEATYNGTIVGGTIFLKHSAAVWQDVPLSWLSAGPAPALNDFADRMRKTQEYAVRNGYIGGFPNFFHANYGAGTVCGTVLIHPSAAEFRDVPLSELGNPSLTDIRQRFTSANDYAFRNGFLGGFPTFFEADYGKGLVCGIILIRKEAGEWRDVPLAQMPR